MTSRVQDGGSVGTALTIAPARAPPVLYEDALFLLIAEGRVPTRLELLVFVLGFAASLSLVFITSDLMNARPLRPSTGLVFLVSASYCGVLVRRQRIAAAEFAAEEERLAAEARRPTPVVIDRETRRQLLNYFVLCPPENDKELDKKGSINASSSSFGNIGRGSGTQEESDAIGSSGRGASVSKSVRDVSSRLPTLSNPTPDPHPPPGATSPPSALVSPLPLSPDIEEAGGVNARESNGSGESEEGGSPTVAADSSTTHDKRRGKNPGETNGSISDAKDSAERDGTSDATTNNAIGPESIEADGEGPSSESCIVCFGDYSFGEELCRLPCRHLYHAKCIDEWFDGEHHGWCPLCKTDVIPAAASTRSATGNNRSSSSSSSRVSITRREDRRLRRQRNDGDSFFYISAA
eukprot:g14180.t1